jgi:hypothetical protein
MEIPVNIDICATAIFRRINGERMMRQRTDPVSNLEAAPRTLNGGART